jgi:hypothetical protein
MDLNQTASRELSGVEPLGEQESTASWVPVVSALRLLSRLPRRSSTGMALRKEYGVRIAA